MLDLDALAKALQEARDGRSRRGLARDGTLGVSHLQKLESASVGDVTVGTLLRAAETYKVHPLQLFLAVASLDEEGCREWLAQRQGGGVALKTLGEDMEELKATVRSLEESAIRLEELRPVVPVLAALVASLSEMQEQMFGHDHGLEDLRGALQAIGGGDDDAKALADLRPSAGTPENG